jgi:hypothetical protein
MCNDTGRFFGVRKAFESKKKTLAELNPKYDKTIFTTFILNSSSGNCR